MKRDWITETNDDMVQTMQGTSDEEFLLLYEKEYKVDYVLKNPPKYASKNKDVWKEAFREYLSRQKLDMDKIKKVDNIEWNEVIRIYNTLIGKKNRKRPKNFKRGQKNKDLIASDTQMEGFQMDKKYLRETNEMFATSEMDSVRHSEVLHVKVQDIYKVAEQFLGDDAVGFIADHSSGLAQDNLRKLDFCQELVDYSPENGMVIMQRLAEINKLRQRYMEIEEEEEKLETYMDALDEEEDAIEDALESFGLVAEEDDEEEPEVYTSDGMMDDDD